MVAGAIPVLFWRRTAYDQYRWFLPAGQRGKEKEWSVFMDRRALSVGNVSVLDVLQGFSEQRVRRMRERVVEMIPRLVYGSSSHGLGDGMADAFEVALDGVVKRFRQRRWSIEREGACFPVLTVFNDLFSSIFLAVCSWINVTTLYLAFFTAFCYYSLMAKYFHAP
jgi:hypothetical protein